MPPKVQEAQRQLEELKKDPEKNAKKIKRLEDYLGSYKTGTQMSAATTPKKNSEGKAIDTSLASDDRGVQAIVQAGQKRNDAKMKDRRLTGSPVDDAQRRADVANAELDVQKANANFQAGKTGGKQVANTNKGVAGAKPGDWIVRSNGQKYILKQEDIDWAKKVIAGPAKPQSPTPQQQHPAPASTTPKQTPPAAQSTVGSYQMLVNGLNQVKAGYGDRFRRGIDKSIANGLIDAKQADAIAAQLLSVGRNADYHTIRQVQEKYRLDDITRGTSDKQFARALQQVVRGGLHQPKKQPDPNDNDYGFNFTMGADGNYSPSVN